MNHQTRSKIALFIMIAICATFFPLKPLKAADPDCSEGKVIINEVAWAGSTDSTYDEWLELYNATCNSVDLAGWTIEDSGSTYIIPSGAITKSGYFIIEDKEETITDVQSSAIINLSLSNSGEKLILKNTQGTIIDSVNSAGGAWYAGNNTTKATMERINSFLDGDNKDNWATATASSGAHSSLGSVIMGTPGAKNSVSYNQQDIANIEIIPGSPTPARGSILTLTSNITGVKDLFSYGVNILYNPTVLKFDSVQKGSFLNSNNSVATSFAGNIQDNQNGLLIVGEARTISPQVGISGSGTLFTAKFQVIGEVDDATSLEIQTDSFASSPTGDIITAFKSTAVTVAPGSSVTDPVTNLTAQQATNRYNLKLSWTAPTSGATSYKILRKDTLGNFIEVGSSTTSEFTDDKKIVPNLTYYYQVKAVKDDVESSAVEVNTKETRGLKGDLDRSDRVDGRDLDKLAKQFAFESSTSGFDALIDLNYDGKINGNDLIDLASNWALTYSQ